MVQDHQIKWRTKKKKLENEKKIHGRARIFPKHPRFIVWFINLSRIQIRLNCSLQLILCARRRENSTERGKIKGEKYAKQKEKKRHRRHRRYCATANIFKQTLRSRRWSSFPHQKIFPNDTQRERATEKERVLNLMVWLCVQHSVHWQTERKTTKSVKRARESDFRAKIKGNDDK